MKREALTQEQIKIILSKGKTIAVVGLSRDKKKQSHRVSKYMQMHGYRIIPINPFADEVLGEKSFKSLLELPEELQKEVDIVDVFRKAEDVLPVARQAVKLKKKHGSPHVLWMQLEIVNEQAAKAARKAGMIVVMDKCLMLEHKRLFK
jgi:predicted CoA-binding protein